MEQKTPYEVIVLGDPDDPSDSLRGLVQTIVDYTAKQITACLDIISKEYGHSREDLADLLRNDKCLDSSLKEKMGLIIQTTTKTGSLPPFGGRKVVIKKKPALGQPAPSKGNSQ